MLRATRAGFARRYVVQGADANYRSLAVGRKLPAAVRELPDTGALDARFYQVIPVAAPTNEKRAQPYLWRFWLCIPRAGRLTMFDRSRYGRELMERVEVYCSESCWMRTYGDINDFEPELRDVGIIVVKF